MQHFTKAALLITKFKNIGKTIHGIGLAMGYVLCLSLNNIESLIDGMVALKRVHGQYSH